MSIIKINWEEIIIILCILIIIIQYLYYNFIRVNKNSINLRESVNKMSNELNDDFVTLTILIKRFRYGKREPEYIFEISGYSSNKRRFEIGKNIDEIINKFKNPKKEELEINEIIINSSDIT